MMPLARWLLRSLAAVAVLVAAVAAGTGWLYLIRDATALDAGSGLTGALPLQRLAGQDTQPLLRVLVAWLPAAAGAAFALAAATRLRRPTRALVAGVGSFAALFALGALADSITASDPVSLHVSSQFGKGADWVVAALFVAAGLIPPRRERPAGSWVARAGATRSGASARAAA